MANQPYLALYTGDWKKDHNLSLCSPATRGVWIDLLCSLHDGRIGNVTGTPHQLAQLCRTDAASMHASLLELQATGAANVSERNGVFTIICRRMTKALEVSQSRAKAGAKGGARNKQKEPVPEYENEDEGKQKVREFCTSISIGEKDADWFFWKCHANGWKNAGQPILDWRGTLRSWQKAGYLPSQKTRSNGNRPSITNPPMRMAKSPP